jgi:hypothetical protein
VSAWHDRSESIDGIASAMSKALGDMTDVVKTQTANAGQYGYTYATLADVLGMARPVLAKHNLCVTQAAESIAAEVIIYTTVLHSSGQFLSAHPLRLPIGKTPQSVGSAISYGKRYAIMAVLGLATEDDDGQSAASTPVVRSQSRSQPERPSTTPTARTPEEGRIRAILSDLPPDERAAFREAFVDEWGAPLSELEPSLHPAALAWLEAFTAAPLVVD